MTNWLDKHFAIAASGSSIGTEVIAGTTTFLTMAYIIVVNPAILSDAGMDFDAVFVATCLAAALGSLAMGLLANYPVAVAPGMGQNAFFTYAIVIGAGYDWQTALGAVFLSGVLFVLISVLPVREWVINAIPRNQKLGIAAGIGIFLAFIALQNAGIIVNNDATLVGLGDLTHFGPVTALAGFVLIAALAARGFRAAVLVGMLAAAAAGWLTGEAPFLGVTALPPSPAPVLLQLDIAGAFSLSMLTIVLSLLLVDVFDTAGTLVGVATQGNMLDEQGRLPRLRNALLADSSATLLGSLLGTSSTTSYLESISGVSAGGRTGLTAVVVALLFLACLVLAPLAQSIPDYATAAALLFVAVMMTRSLAHVDWDDMTEACPAAITALTIPLSYSIADGIGLGFICYLLIKLAAGRHQDISPAMAVIAALFAVKFTIL
ncbi:NCS2 family permease [Candidatus Marimicrobium litorale]|uniref:NCS2 family permease n=1 Tax=Candidatus Marimicrobium litorale TaxID=2518991 RepID=A0ABT3T7S1_9GAMM|nr:NCS2 family permease [Candidatus Marimicrobium litorale]MCX2977900.1 NCS2 family permease [Candidatus Marimicrobium litorale]